MRVAPPLPFLLAAASLLAIGCDAAPFREVEVDLESSPVVPSTAADEVHVQTLRFAVAAMESPRDTSAGYERLLERLGRSLGVEVELVQRRTYRELNDMLTAGQLDVALICIGGYFDLRRRAPHAFDLLAVPVIGGETTYRSIVIAPARSSATSVADLAGKRFAFTDELSFSGHLYFASVLRAKGTDPERLFGEILYTHSHDRSIEAVAAGIADGAVVSSVVYQHQLDRRPELATSTRVLERSPPFGLMPIVVTTRLPEADRARIRRALLTLHEDAEAARAMASLRFDRFEIPAPDLYDSAAAILERSE